MEAPKTDTLKELGLGVFFNTRAWLDFIDLAPVTTHFILRGKEIGSFLHNNASAL